MIEYIRHFLKQLLPKPGWKKVTAHQSPSDGLEAFMARVKMNSHRLR